MPWLDEVRKFYNNSGGSSWFTYSVGNGVTYKSSTPGNFLISYLDGNEIELSSDKTYAFKHKINKTSSIGDININHFLDDNLSIYDTPAPFGPNILIQKEFSINLYNGSGDIYYSYYKPLYNRKTNKVMTYWFNKNIGLDTPTNTVYVDGFTFEEIDFYPNGFKSALTNTSSGWYFDNDNYNFFHNGPITPTEPIWSPDQQFKEPFISKKIDSDLFNIEFNFNITTSPVGLNLDLYLINDIDYDNWIHNGGSFSFNDYTPEKSYTTGGVISEIGLNGRDKYLVLKLTNWDSAVTKTEISLSNIKITGTYDNTVNNELTSSLLTPNSVYKFEHEITTGVNLNSYIGNGKFLSGIWEDGVWNNGVRIDEESFEFIDVLNSYPVSNSKWRIEIQKSSLLTSTELSLIGESISIGNIVAININEERKLLKNLYLVVDAKDDYIVVESEFLFPIRRIEKDSNKHRIKVSKNIWLSGAFLNGKFNGIWNNGIFKGNPSNNVMGNTQWIDGTFDGGRFVSNYNNSGTFSVYGSEEMDNISYVVITPSGVDLSKVFLGDEVYIENSSYYNGNSVIINIDGDNITIDKTFNNHDSGDIKILISDGLIQNFEFNDNNLSKSSSIKTISSSSVFKYNSWIDVEYDENSAVNIGRDVKTKDPITGKVVSKNNLYGYPTYDILSSTSKFRNSINTNSRLYRLGTKYKKYTDFVGDSSSFNKPFDFTNQSNFFDQGWTYSYSNGVSGLSFSRTEFDINNQIIEGKELHSYSKNIGGVLDNTNINIENNRYSLVEYDVINIGTFSKVGVSGPSDDLITTTSLSDGRNYPIVNMSNLNYEGVDNVDMTYLPIFRNVNLLDTPNSKKLEYFFNKENFLMDIRGYGNLDNNSIFELVIDNLKFYEVDMIPFFKYFNYNNIYKGVQIPLEGTSPFVDYTLNKFPFIESQSIPFDSIDIRNKV